MDASPIRIAIELDGIETNDRFDAAARELVAAAAELLKDTAEVSGYAYDLNPSQVWTDMRPGLRGINIGGFKFSAADG